MRQCRIHVRVTVIESDVEEVKQETAMNMSNACGPIGGPRSINEAVNTIEVNAEVPRGVDPVAFAIKKITEQLV